MHASGAAAPAPDRTSTSSLYTGGTAELLNGGNIHGYERTDPFFVNGFWKFDSLPAVMRLVQKGVFGGTFRGWSLQTAGPHLLLVLRSDFGTGKEILLQKNNALATGNWYQLTVSVDGSSTAAGCKVWINRVLQTMTVGTDALSGTIVNAGAFSINGMKDGATWYVTGKVNQVLIGSGTTLSQSDVEAFADGSGHPVDPTSHPKFGNVVSHYALASATDAASFPVFNDTVGSFDLTYEDGELADLSADLP